MNERQRNTERRGKASGIESDDPPAKDPSKSRHDGAAHQRDMKARNGEEVRETDRGDHRSMLVTEGGPIAEDEGAGHSRAARWERLAHVLADSSP